jgi:hypothetical protein
LVIEEKTTVGKALSVSIGNVDTSITHTRISL